MARKGYPAEFRRRALDLVAAGKPVADVARLLEVSDQSISSWRRQELIDRGELPGLSSEEREELRAARRRIRELETELAVHRRAAELPKEEVRPKGALTRGERGTVDRPGRLPVLSPRDPLVVRGPEDQEVLTSREDLVEELQVSGARRP
jgi:transposase-like protein